MKDSLFLDYIYIITQNIDLAGSTSEPMKCRLFIDHMITTFIDVASSDANVYARFIY